MYESPIKIRSEIEKIGSQIDDEIMRYVQTTIIDIDKNELLKALNDDRERYWKGYTDGLNYLRQSLEKLYSEFGWSEDELHFSLSDMEGNIDAEITEMKKCLGK